MLLAEPAIRDHIRQRRSECYGRRSLLRRKRPRRQHQVVHALWRALGLGKSLARRAQHCLDAVVVHVAIRFLRGTEKKEP